MSSRLPSVPSLDQLKNQAKDFRRAFMAGETHAIERVRSAHPAYKQGTPTDLTLRDSQLVIAREYFFEDWPRLKEYCMWDVAVIEQDLPRIEKLLKERPERSQQEVMRFRQDGTHWGTPSVAFANNNIPMLEMLLAHGATLATPSQAVLKPESSPEYIDFALRHGADLETQYYNGTVLSIAAYAGNAVTVNHYISRGAVVNTRCDTEELSTWETPLHRASFCHPRLRGFNRDAWDGKRDYPTVVRALIEAGAEVNVRTNVGVESDMGRGIVVQGETPLHFAAASGAAEIVVSLMAAGADVLAETAEGEKAVDLARRHHREEVIKQLEN